MFEGFFNAGLAPLELIKIFNLIHNELCGSENLYILKDLLISSQLTSTITARLSLRSILLTSN